MSRSPLDLARQHPQALRLAVAPGHGEVGTEIEPFWMRLSIASSSVASARCTRTTPIAELVSSTEPDRRQRANHISDGVCRCRARWCRHRRFVCRSGLDTTIVYFSRVCA